MSNVGRFVRSVHRHHKLALISIGGLDETAQFQAAVEAALNTGEFGQVASLLAADVECVTPQHSVYGVEAMLEELGRARPSETFQVEFENGDWKHLGDARYSRKVRALVRRKETGELSFSRDRSFELTISSGKVSRYEMRFDA